MVGYLAKFKNFMIQFHVDPPYYSSIPKNPDQDWKYTPYGNPTKDLSLDSPKPPGKPIVLNHYFDANMMHDMLSGKA